MEKTKWTLKENDGWRGICPECGCEGLHYCMGRSMVPQWTRDVEPDLNEAVEEGQWMR